MSDRPAEIRFGDWVYTGRDGFGVIPEFRRAKPQHTVQLTLIDCLDRVGAVAQRRLSPLRNKRKPKKRKRPQLTLPFMTEEDSVRAPVPAPVPGLPGLLEPRERMPKMEQELPDGRVLAVPASTEELVARYGLTYLNADVVLYYSEQARAILLSSEIDANLLFIAHTNFGKTLVELAIADRVISSGGKIIIFTPMEDLVDQFGRDAVQKVGDQARCFFNFTEEMLCLLSGDIDPEERQLEYQNAERRIYITTPETFVNDMRSGKVDPGMFALAVFDEAHRAVGRYAYVEAAEVMHSHGVKVRAFSATLPDRDDRLAQCLEAFRVDEHTLFRLRGVSKKLKFEGTLYTPADPETIEIADLLFSAAAQSAYSLADNIGAAVHRDNGILTEGKLVLDRFRRATYTGRGAYRVPAFRDNTEVGSALRRLMASDIKRFGKCYSKWCEHGELVYLYHLLTCYGKYAFLRSMAKSYWRVNNLPGVKEEKRTFKRMVARNELVFDAYRRLAEGTPFALLRPSVPSLFRIRKAVAADRDDERALQNNAKEVRRRYFEKAQAELVAREYVDSAFERKCLLLVERHATFGNREQIQIYSNDANHAKFLAARVERYLSNINYRALPYTGKKHMSRRVRRENLKQFRDGVVSTLVGTSAIREGLHTKCNVLILTTPVCVAGDLEQLRGRPGRGEKPAIIYYLVVPNALSEIWFWAGWRRHKKFKERISGKD